MTAKAETKKHFCFHFGTTDGFLLGFVLRLTSRRDTSDFTSGQIPDVSSPDAFASVMTETRHYFLGRNALRTIAVSSSSSVLSMTLSLGTDSEHMVKSKDILTSRISTVLISGIIRVQTSNSQLRVLLLFLLAMNSP